MANGHAGPTGEPRLRTDVLTARRIVVKVGSSSLTTTAGGLDPDRVDALVDVLARTRSADTEVVLVSSGAIAAGLAPLGLTRRPRDLARQQAAACVGQGLLVARYTASFARHGVRVGQVLLTADDISRRAHYRNAYRALGQVLAMGAVPVVNENDTVATEEIKFGDNDRLAALVAHLVRADLLILLSDVDGLYDGDPGRPGSQRLREVRGRQDLVGVEIGSAGSSGVGTGGMVTKVEAARIATDAGIPVVLTAARHAADALAGRETGTFFHRTGNRASDHLLWLEHASSPRGVIGLDADAVRLLSRGEGPLLAAGVTRAEGDFIVGDAVELLDEAGRVIARGLACLDVQELSRLLGRSEREVVHRDDLVLLPNATKAGLPPRRLPLRRRVSIRIRPAHEVPHEIPHEVPLPASAGSFARGAHDEPPL
ncbi:glutamate 5-kinase [Streptomyces sp. NPDC087263]|uniref:glutamate 5-kinase n=1 Tax=Streptomyces sp. NPDC087263 TaxID=3365773 RepID=UPI0037FB5752